MLPTVSAAHPLWYAITRLGEAQLVLPATLAATVWVARQTDIRALMWRWALLLVGAVALTTATKLAFIGWGVGAASLDFTGISGHAMFASAAYPLLLRLTLAYRPNHWQHVAWVAGFALAALVAVSRVVVGAHSVSEIVAGFALGGAVGLLALPKWRVRDVAPSLALPFVLLLWVGLHLPIGSGVPSVDTHGLVTRLALALSSRDTPFTRGDLHRAAAAGGAGGNPSR